MANGKKKSKKQPGDEDDRLSPATPIPRPPSPPPGTAAERLVEMLRKNGGWQKACAGSGYDGTQVYYLPAMRGVLEVVFNPKHPDNKWGCLVECVRIGESLYLHLIENLPPSVMAEWAGPGGPPRYVASTDMDAVVGGMDDSPVAKPSSNPYKPGTQYHRVFEMAAAWIPFDELLARITRDLCEGKEDNARSLWSLVAKPDPKRNKERSISEERVVDGVRQVRLVATGNP